MRALFSFSRLMLKKIKIDGKEVSLYNIGRKLSIKSVDDATGIIEAYVSIFGNVDAANEIVEKGAFTESLKRKLPKAVWSHDWTQPIGTVLEAVEDEKGLYVKMQLVLTVQKAKEAYELMKSGAIDEFSIGYGVEESTIDEKGVRHLTKLTLYEVSPVLVGCNPDTELISVKGAEVKEEPAGTEEKGEVAAVIEERDVRRMKWEKMEGVDKIMSALYTAYFADETKPEDFDGLLAEAIGLLGKLIGTTEATEDEKAAFAGIMEKALVDAKAGRVISGKNRELIKQAIEAMDMAVSPLSEGKKVLEALLDAAETPEPKGASPAGVGTQEKVDEHAPGKIRLIRREAQQGIKRFNGVLRGLKQLDK